jgi:hypothetical protein
VWNFSGSGPTGTTPALTVGHRAVITCQAWQPDGEGWLATAGRDGRMMVYDTLAVLPTKGDNAPSLCQPGALAVTDGEPRRCRRGACACRAGKPVGASPCSCVSGRPGPASLPSAALLQACSTRRRRGDGAGVWVQRPSVHGAHQRHGAGVGTSRGGQQRRRGRGAPASCWAAERRWHGGLSIGRWLLMLPLLLFLACKHLSPNQ